MLFLVSLITPWQMKKTQKKIIITAIRLFNHKGVGNIRLQDIAKAAQISPGNLTYHYKTKKKLMEAVLHYMSAARLEMRSIYQPALEATNWIDLMKNYLHFQIKYRFFNRDILEIICLVPEAKTLFEQQIEYMVSFSKNSIYLAIGKGYMLPEPRAGHYDIFAKNLWAILHSWLREREVLGEEKVGLYQAMLAVLEMHYYYFTDTGQELYLGILKQLPDLVEKEISI